MVSIPGELKPIARYADADTRSRVEALEASARKAHPGIAPPSIYVIEPQRTPEWDDMMRRFPAMSFGDIIAERAQLPPDKQQISQDVSIYLMLDSGIRYIKDHIMPDGSKRDIVAIGKGLYDHLGSRERAAVIGHEFGHHYIGKLEPQPENPTPEQKRIEECKAAQWARFHVNPMDLALGLAKAVKLEQQGAGGYAIPSQDDTHPPLANRSAALGQDRSRWGALHVPLDDQCQLKAPATPAAPTAPDASRPR